MTITTIRIDLRTFETKLSIPDHAHFKISHKGYLVFEGYSKDLTDDKIREYIKHRCRFNIEMQLALDGPSDEQMKKNLHLKFPGREIQKLSETEITDEIEKTWDHYMSRALEARKALDNFLETWPVNIFQHKRESFIRK